MHGGASLKGKTERRREKRKAGEKKKETGSVVLLYFLPVIIIHCYCTKSALTQFGFCNHYVIHVNKLSFSALAKFNLPSRYDILVTRRD